jgi:uncharacterized protein YbjT (DUF2867 family)
MKQIALFGATGVAGAGVLRACLASPDVAGVVSIARRAPDVRHPTLRDVRCADIGRVADVVADIGPVDACFYCLGISGTRIDEASYRVITMDYALAAARALGAASPRHSFYFVSGGGASVNSRMMWARVKGETELALGTLRLAGLVVLRPGLIVGDRTPGGLSPLLRLAYPLVRLGRYIPAASIEAEALGCAMLQLLHEGASEGTLENAALRAAAARYRARTRVLWHNPAS